MEVLIPIIGVLGDLYKILITIRNTLVRLSRKFLEIPESIMIDQTNVVESESVGNWWLHGFPSTRTSLFLNRTFVTLHTGRRETICDSSVYWRP